ncbi:MAG: TRAP transporter substrate-binding protein DctP [Rhodobacterales bacterium]|nr:TRAP transporter substrate-binding protein DctP [Rhodobacterales bacterium]MDX5498519.1 TRAP transporter substrate-binding protein DctP [Rhodobacterales bacterium]
MKTIFGSAILAVLCAVAPQAGAAQDYPDLSLRMAHVLPQTWPAVEWDAWWAEEVARRSNGKIRIEVFWSGQLGGMTEAKSLVSSGAVDFGVFAQAVFASELPLTAATAGLLNRVSATSQAAHELGKAMYRSPEVAGELADQNLHILKWTVASPYTLQCNKPVNSTADLKGLRVRAVGGAYVPIWMETFGMVPTRVQATELREGLTRGTLDCNFGPIEWVPFADIKGIAPYWSDINTGAFSTFQLYASKSSWDKLPENVRTLLTEVAAEAMERDQAALPEIAAKAEADYLASGGQKVALTDMDRLVEMSPDMIDVWVERSTAEGRGAAAEALAPLMREAAKSFAN